MPPLKKRLLLLVCLALLALLAIGVYVLWVSPDRQPKPWGRSGAASFADASLLRDGHTYALGSQTVLQVGDIIMTSGHDAELAHKSGTLLRLGPLSKLRLGEGAPEDVDLALLIGAVRVETGRGVLSMPIGTPFATLQTDTDRLTVLDISVEQVYVRVGAVTIEQNNQSRSVGQGFKIDIHGAVQPIGPGDALILDELVFPFVRAELKANAHDAPRKPLSLSLVPTQSTRYVRVGTASRVPAEVQPLVLDDQVLTQGSGAMIRLDTWGQLQLDPNAAVRIAEASANATEASVAIIIEAGGTDFHLEKQAGKQQMLRFRVGKLEAQLRAGYMAASGHISRQSNHLVVALQLGQLDVGDRHIEAGSYTVIDANGIRTGPLVPRAAPAHAGRHTEVHSAQSTSDVAFEWPQGRVESAHLVEIARDANFHDVRMAEQLHSDRFVVTHLAGGRSLYWRVDQGPAAVLRSLAPPPNTCAHCLSVDPITDELRRVDIRYDSIMPELGFAWQPHAGAAYYLFRMWRANHFAHPVAVAHAREPNFTLDSSRIEAGDYVWKVASYNDEGYLLQTSKVFELSVQSSRPTLINIYEPPAIATADQNSIMTHGMTGPEKKLQCNGTVIPVDSDGYFEQPIALHPGHNVLNYTLTEDGVDHVFVREVEWQQQPAR